MQKVFIAAMFLLTSWGITAQTKKLTTKVLVVGGGTGGIAAGLQAARSGTATIIIEPTHMLGGMLTAAAVSCTDGNNLLKSGIWQSFRIELYKHYKTTNLESGWVSNTCFEPHVGDSIFKAWAANEPNLKVKYGWYFSNAITNKNVVTGANFVNLNGGRLTIYADVVIDATDLGDVFASAGAAFDVGMESPAYSNEKVAPGKNNIIQDLTWSAILKDYGKGLDKTITKPQGYDPSLYFCSTGDAPCNGKPYPLNTAKVLAYGKLTTADTLHPKYMINWPAHGNDFYLNVTGLPQAARGAVYKNAKNKTLGFIYFFQTQLGFKNIALADDEVDNGMAWIPYHREGRRLKGIVRLNINHIENPYQYNLFKTGIAVGDYPVDHHHGQYPGAIPAIHFPAIPSYNIPIGALIPQKIDGLIVCDKGISVSNIANGTTRLQPVVLLTGQAAGEVAAQAIQQKIIPRKVSIRKVQLQLLQHKCYLMPFCDVSPEEEAWEAIQKAGVTGILQGTGKSSAWENKTFFYPDSTVNIFLLEKDINACFKTNVQLKVSGLNTLTIASATNIITIFQQQIKQKGLLLSDGVTVDIAKLNKNIWEQQLHLHDFNLTRDISRKEFAVLFMFYNNKAFENDAVDFNGDRIFLKKVKM